MNCTCFQQKKGIGIGTIIIDGRSTRKERPKVSQVARWAATRMNLKGFWKSTTEYRIIATLCVHARLHKEAETALLYPDNIFFVK